MSDPAISFRPAFADERARAATLCEASAAWPGDGETRCFLAVKSRPVERIVGAAFWREREHGAAFEWEMVAAMQGSPAETDFLNALAAEIRLSTAEVQCSTWLEPHSPATETLAGAGFQEIAHRETFTGKLPAWRKKLVQIPEGGFQVFPLTQEHAAGVKALLSGSEWLEPELVHAFGNADGENPSLFDFHSSTILLRDGKISGVCLALTDLNRTHLRISALALAAGEIALDSGVAALIRHPLAVSSLKELSIQRLGRAISSSSIRQPAFDHLLTNYPVTLSVSESRHGKSL